MATAKRARTTKKSTEPKTEASSKPIASAKSEVATVTTRTVDLQDSIRQRAFEIYEERGGQHGADLEDWVRAEREVMERFRGRTA